MKKLEMVLTLPGDVSIDEFMDTAMAQVRGRYPKADYYRAVEPTLHFMTGGNKRETYSVYHIDAVELDPAIISSILTITHLMKLAAHFKLDGKVLCNIGWWRPTAEETHPYAAFEEVDSDGNVRYDEYVAQLAREIYDAKVKAYTTEDKA